VEYDENMVKAWSFLQFFFVLNFFVLFYEKIYSVLKQLNSLYILNPHSKILMLIFVKMLTIH
jgi:hypothetical protein